MAGVACGTLRHSNNQLDDADNPESPTADDDLEDGAYDDGQEAAERWGYLTTKMLGTCSRLKDEPSSEAVDGDRWHAYRSALDGTSSAIWAALVFSQIEPSAALQSELNQGPRPTPLHLASGCWPTGRQWSGPTRSYSTFG
jgi:hypothetical protein